MNCSKAKGCRHYLTGIGCMVCENENNFKPLRETNADRIRSMSDEELAHAFAYQCAGRVCRGIPFDGPNECENCWLEWLKKESDNGE